MKSFCHGRPDHFDSPICSRIQLCSMKRLVVPGSEETFENLRQIPLWVSESHYTQMIVEIDPERIHKKMRWPCVHYLRAQGLWLFGYIQEERIRLTCFQRTPWERRVDCYKKSNEKLARKPHATERVLPSKTIEWIA